MPFAELNDVTLFYTDDGTGGPPVLFVHGWACDSHDWIFQLPTFVQHHRCIAVDNRGHGSSSVTEGGYRPRELADDLAALIRHLGLGPIVAVGHSLGGAIVAALAVEHPSLVRAVVEVDPAYGYDGPRAAAVHAALPRHTGPDCVDHAAATLSSLDGPSTPPALNTWHRRRALGMPAHAVADTQRGLWDVPDQFGFRPASDSYVARRRCPVLTFTLSEKWGSWETAVFSDPYSRLVAWEGCGHWLHQERADDFNELVLSWIAGLPA